MGLTRSFAGARQVSIAASSEYSVFRSGTTEKLATLPAATPITIKISGTEISLVPQSGEPTPAGPSVTVVPGDAAAAVNVSAPSLNAKRYRGKIEVSLQSSGLLIVNVLDIEQYLPGVLVGEMPSSFPPEALKSQAVAARCYTLCSMQKHRDSGFNLCDGNHCQVYDGCLRETPQVRNAVSATAGEILTYKGKIASIMYHSDSGGVTQSYAEAYPGGDYPYLCGVVEPEGVPYSIWEKSYKTAELEAMLVEAGLKDAEGLLKLSITRTSTSGRALEVSYTGAKGSGSLSGVRLRTMLGTGTLRSTLFTVETDDAGNIIFKGKGRGHGVGMSQVGAKALAAPPFNYTYGRILTHYFPGTVLTSSDCPTGAGSAVSPETQQPTAPAAKTKTSPPRTLSVRVREPKL